jgi:DNA-directed RNA polymerase specialized sigma24 family protein
MTERDITQPVAIPAPKERNLLPQKILRRNAEALMLLKYERAQLQECAPLRNKDRTPRAEPVNRLSRAELASMLTPLNPLETAEIVRGCIAEGMTNSEIARTQGIHKRTVNYHSVRLRAKFLLQRVRSGRANGSYPEIPEHPKDKV